MPQIPEVKEKLKQGVVDFEKLSEEGEGKKLKEGGWDVVFITCVLSLRLQFMLASIISILTIQLAGHSMGTTRKAAGSFEMFYKIDRE